MQGYCSHLSHIVFIDPHVTAITLQKVVRALQYRGVSVASDEPICLVKLLDIDAKILNEQDGSPMSRFWRALCGIRLVPRTVLFFKGPKLEDDGFRWAPATLLGTGHLLPDYQEPAVLNKNGLSMHFPGVVIHRPVFDIIILIMNKRQRLPDIWYLLDRSTGRRYGIVIKRTDVQTCIFGENDDGESQVKMLKDEKGKEFAIIFSHDPNAQKGTHRIEPPNAMFCQYQGAREWSVLWPAPRRGTFHHQQLGGMRIVQSSKRYCTKYVLS